MAHCYAIASGKGGVGKSAFTANLGAALSGDGKKVILIDTDIGLRSLDALLSLENSVVYDLIDLANNDCELEEAILASEEYPNLSLLPAAQFRRAKSLEPKQFRKIISVLRERWDYILIDCPAGIERGLRNVLNSGVDDTLLIVTPDDVAVRSAERAVQVITSKSLPRPMLIVNRLDADLIHTGEMMSAKTVSELMDLPLIGEIPEDQTFCRAMLRHSLLFTYQCEARSAILRIASRLEGKDVPFPVYGQKAKTSWLYRLLSGKPKEVIPLDDH